MLLLRHYSLKMQCDAWVVFFLTSLIPPTLLQSDVEKLEGLPVTPFMDRDKVTKPSSQTGFIRFVLLPLFIELANLFPCLEVSRLTNVRRNIIRGGRTFLSSSHPAILRTFRSNTSSTRSGRRWITTRRWRRLWRGRVRTGLRVRTQPRLKKLQQMATLMMHRVARNQTSDLKNYKHETESR